MSATTKPKPAKKTPKKRGPIPKPPGEKAVILSTSLPPAVAAWLVAVGNGSTSRGMRTVLVSAHQEAGEKILEKS